MPSRTEDITEGLQGFLKPSTIIKSVLLLFLLIFGVKACNRTFVTVPAGSRGVVMAFGHVQDQVLNEGLHMVMPWRDQVKNISVQILRSDIKMSAASGDMQDVHSEVVINWSMNPESVNKLYQTVGDEDVFAEKIIGPAVLESFKAATANRHADEILKKREELRSEFSDALVAKLKAYPILIVAASITDINFSPEYKKAIEEKQVAEQSAQKAVYEALEAKNTAQARINEAYGVAQANKLKSETVTPKILQLEWIKKWDGTLPTFIAGNASGIMMNMNLDSIKKVTKAQEEAQ